MAEDGFDEIDDLIAYFVGEGYLELEFDDQGESWMSPTDKMKSDYPEAYDAIIKANMAAINEEIESLMEKGLIEIAGIDEHGEMTFRLTDKGELYAQTLLPDE